MLATSTPLVALEILAACVWVGSLVCLAVVTNAARRVLDGPAQVALFRAVGRRYGIVGTGALAVAIGVGLAMAWPPAAWSTTIDAAVALAGALVVATVAGMVQARAMTRLRRRAVTDPQDGIAAAVRRGRRMAGGLRGVMAALTLAIVVLAALAITR
jgi:uncharacterized membrane protein